MMMIITIIFIITIMITMIIMIFMIIIMLILITTIHVFTKEISSNTPAVVRWLDARILSILTLRWALCEKAQLAAAASGIEVARHRHRRGGCTWSHKSGVACAMGR